jgi:hypothetical protein
MACSSPLLLALATVPPPLLLLLLLLLTSSILFYFSHTTFITNSHLVYKQRFVFSRTTLQTN